MNDEMLDEVEVSGLDPELGEVITEPELLGLGLDRVAARKVRNTVAKKTRQNSIAKHRTKGQDYLKLQSKNFNPDTQKRLAEGNIKFTDGDVYIRRVITGLGGIKELFDDTIDKEVGVTNITKARLPRNVNLMVDRIEVNFATAAGITAKTADLAPITSATDNALFNGELEVKVGTTTLFKQRLNKFQDGKRNQETLKNGVNLRSPFLIPEDTEIQVNVHFAGTMAGTNAEVIEVVLSGDATDKR